MFNQCILMGRICQDLVLKTTQSGASVLSFSIAVDRSFAAKGEERKSDFFNIVAWRSTAEFISRYFTKGRMILVCGELQTRQYVDKNNVTQRVVELIVDKAAFTGEAKQGGQGSYVTPTHPSERNAVEIATVPSSAPNAPFPPMNNLPEENRVAPDRGKQESYSKKEDFVAATNDTDDYPF